MTTLQSSSSLVSLQSVSPSHLVERSTQRPSLQVNCPLEQEVSERRAVTWSWLHSVSLLTTQSNLPIAETQQIKYRAPPARGLPRDLYEAVDTAETQGLETSVMVHTFFWKSNLMTDLSMPI